MIIQIHSDAFLKGDRVRVRSGEFAGCHGTIHDMRRTFQTDLGLVWGYPVYLDGATCCRVASELELERI